MLSALMARPGGVGCVVEQLVGHVPPGNTQALLRVAALVATPPRGVPIATYAAATAPQLLPLLRIPLTKAAALVRHTRRCCRMPPAPHAAAAPAAHGRHVLCNHGAARAR